jgi:hypothetical protein
MNDLTVKRTLVKSPPELWSELSELESLGRHLGEFGEITISRAEPGRRVAWEGERGRGTVEIEASGWGTTVTLTAEVEDPKASSPGAERDRGNAVAADQPSGRHYEPAGPRSAPLTGTQERSSEPVPRGRLGAWLLRRRRARSAPAPSERRRRSAPVLAVAIEDGAIEVVEAGSATGCTGAPEPERQVGEVIEDDRPESGRGAGTIGSERALEILEATLESLGAAHHRPFSRE